MTKGKPIKLQEIRSEKENPEKERFEKTQLAPESRIGARRKMLIKNTCPACGTGWLQRHEPD
jgi:hypothetical protein